MTVIDILIFIVAVLIPTISIAFGETARKLHFKNKIGGVSYNDFVQYAHSTTIKQFECSHKDLEKAIKSNR